MIALINGFVPREGDVFELFGLAETAGGPGGFDSLALPGLSDGLRFDTAALLTTGQLTVVTPEPSAILVLVGAGVLVRARRRR